MSLHGSQQKKRAKWYQEVTHLAHRKQDWTSLAERKQEVTHLAQQKQEVTHLATIIIIITHSMRSLQASTMYVCTYVHSCGCVCVIWSLDLASSAVGENIITSF